MAKGK
jgi:hypothetical protein